MIQASSGHSILGATRTDNCQTKAMEQTPSLVGVWEMAGVLMDLAGWGWGIFRKSPPTVGGGVGGGGSVRASFHPHRRSIV